MWQCMHNAPGTLALRTSARPTRIADADRGNDTTVAACIRIVLEQTNSVCASGQTNDVLYEKYGRFFISSSAPSSSQPHTNVHARPGSVHSHIAILSLNFVLYQTYRAKDFTCIIMLFKSSNREVHRHVDARGDTIIYKFDASLLFTSSHDRSNNDNTNDRICKATNNNTSANGTSALTCAPHAHHDSPLTVYHEWRHILPKQIHLSSILLDGEDAKARWMKDRRPAVGLVLWEGLDGDGRRARARFVGWEKSESGFVFEVHKRQELGCDGEMRKMIKE